MKESNSELREKINLLIGEHYAWIIERLGNPITSYTEADHEKNRFIDEMLDLFHQHTAQIAEEVAEDKFGLEEENTSFNRGWNSAIDAAVKVIKDNK